MRTRCAAARRAVPTWLHFGIRCRLRASTKRALAAGGRARQRAAAATSRAAGATGERDGEQEGQTTALRRVGGGKPSIRFTATILRAFRSLTLVSRRHGGSNACNAGALKCGGRRNRGEHFLPILRCSSSRVIALPPFWRWCGSVFSRLHISIALREEGGFKKKR